jgi:hypothetical protein
MKYILSHPRLTRSAIPLANKLSELSGEEIKVKIEADGRFLAENKCIVRYGNSSLSAWIDTNFNNSEHIRLAGNKLRLSEFLTEKEFPHVELYSPDDNRNPQDDKYPIVVRKELNRGGGIGLVVCQNIEEYCQNLEYAWSYWYNFQFELGVHILDGEIARVFKKIRDEELEPEKYPIRNTQRGYKFSLRENWKERYRGLESFVKKLYEIIPIQFSRLDVGYDRDTGGYRLIEINSAPDLSQNQNTLNLYADFLKEKIFGG